MSYTDEDLRALSLEALRTLPPGTPTATTLRICAKVREQTQDIYGEPLPLRILVQAAQWAIEHQDGPTVAEQLATALAELERLTAEVATARARIETVEHVAKGNKEHVKYVSEELDKRTAEVAAVRKATALEIANLIKARAEQDYDVARRKAGTALADHAIRRADGLEISAQIARDYAQKEN